MGENKQQKLKKNISVYKVVDGPLGFQTELLPSGPRLPRRRLWLRYRVKASLGRVRAVLSSSGAVERGFPASNPGRAASPNHRARRRPAQSQGWPPPRPITGLVPAPALRAAQSPSSRPPRPCALPNPEQLLSPPASARAANRRKPEGRAGGLGARTRLCSASWTPLPSSKPSAAISSHATPDLLSRAP